MKRAWVVFALAFFTFFGFLMAFGGEGGKRGELRKQKEVKPVVAVENPEKLAIKRSVHG